MKVPADSEALAFRRAMAQFATGVTVVTLQRDGQPYGMTVNSFSSVSLDPPLVLMGVIAGTIGANAVAAAGRFTVNVLAEEQEHLSRHFASRRRPRGWAAFANLPHGLAPSGAPLLHGIAAYFDCRLVSTIPTGDHLVFVGDVTSFEAFADRQPLLFHGAGYHRLGNRLS